MRDLLDRLGRWLGDDGHGLAKWHPQPAFPGGALFASFPVKEFLGAQGVFAYRLRLMVWEHDATRVAAAIAAEFGSPEGEDLWEGVARSPTASAHFSMVPAFGGRAIEIVTNSAALLRRLDAARLGPPAPWEVFADFDPSGIREPAGEMAEWWELYWVPFWRTLGEQERAEFLATRPTSFQWLDLLANNE